MSTPINLSDILSAPHHTDTGNSRRLVAQHGADLHYLPAWGRWLVWDGRRWAADETGEVMRRARDVVQTMYTDAISTADPDERQRQLRWAMRSEADARLRAMVSLAESELPIPVTPDRLDRDPWLLACTNGTIDLRSGRLRPHDRADLITRLVPVAYDPQAWAPTWERFLQRVMDANADLITFLQRAAGYSLTGDVSERCLFFLYGGGRNGKSTFLEALRHVLGGYARRTAAESLLSRRDSTIPNDIAALKGARFVTASEADEGRRLAEGLVKDLTGNEVITARFLRAEWFEFRPEFKIWLAANHKPGIRGTDDGIWDRIKLVPFSVRIPEEECDPHLGDKLRAEAPGILRWAVDGCLQWQAGGLSAPVEVRAAVEIYRGEQDVLGMFVGEECEVGAGLRATAKGLYHAYCQWCEDGGERPMPQRRFGQSLSERNFGQARAHGGERLRLGLALRLG